MERERGRQKETITLVREGKQHNDKGKTNKLRVPVPPCTFLRSHLGHHHRPCDHPASDGRQHCLLGLLGRHEDPQSVVEGLGGEGDVGPVGRPGDAVDGAVGEVHGEEEGRARGDGLVGCRLGLGVGGRMTDDVTDGDNTGHEVEKGLKGVLEEVYILVGSTCLYVCLYVCVCPDIC